MSCSTRTAPPPRWPPTGITLAIDSPRRLAVEFDLDGRGGPLVERGRHDRGDVGLAHDLEVVRAVRPSRAAAASNGRPGWSARRWPAGVDQDDAFDHAAQDGVGVRAFTSHLGDLRAELPRRLVEHVGHRADLVVAMVARRPAEVAALVASRRLGHDPQPAVEQQRRHAR